MARGPLVASNRDIRCTIFATDILYVSGTDAETVVTPFPGLNELSSLKRAIQAPSEIECVPVRQDSERSFSFSRSGLR